MPAATLQSMAQRVCIRSLPGITDVADLPYNIVRPVLRRIQNPEQLREIEKASPQIGEADAELWRAFIGKDIQGWNLLKTEPRDEETWEKVYQKISETFNKDNIIIPAGDSKTWAKLYTKLVKREERVKAEQEEELRAAMSGLTKQREENKANIIDQLVPMKEKESLFIDGVPNPRANGWGVIKTPALQNARRGKDVMAALRTQTRNAVQTRTTDYGKKAGFKTTKPLPTARQQIKSAPEWMVREQMKPVVVAAPAGTRTGPSGGARPGPKVFMSNRKGPSQSERALDAGIRQSNEEREARLRALTQPKAKPIGTISPPTQAARPIAPASQSTEEREARLRALTQPKAKPVGTISPPTQAARPIAPASQSTEEREARLRALTQPKAKPVDATPPPTQAARPIAPATGAVKARPAPRAGSPESPEAAGSRLGTRGTPPSRPSPAPAPQMLKKRPAPSLFTPQKKRRI